ncbi:MAG: DUF1801 domain-containing protein [Aureispira sp.]|nr:DUF1801 domain-containing protein [Aureispira sp.]
MQFDKDLSSPHKALFLEARAFILTFEGVEEFQKERITTYFNDKGGLCHLRTMPHGIDIGFLKGAKMEDKFKLLTGKGKAIRVLAQITLDKEVVHYYIEQGIVINAKK